MTVIASPGQGPDRSTEVSYTDTKVTVRGFVRGGGNIFIFFPFRLTKFKNILLNAKIMR